MNWNSAQDTRDGFNIGTITYHKVLKDVTSVDLGRLLQFLGNTSQELDQHEYEIGIRSQTRTVRSAPGK